MTNIRPVKQWLRGRKLAIVAALSVVLMLLCGFVWNQNTVYIVANGQQYTVHTHEKDPARIVEEAGICLGEQDTIRSSTETVENGTVLTVAKIVPVKITYQGQSKLAYTDKATVSEAIAVLGLSASAVKTFPAEDTAVTPNMEIKIVDCIKSECAPNNRIARAGTVTTSRGDVRYKRAYSMQATAYLPTDGSGHGITKSGIRARRGVVAVDPDVIPLGSRVYIPGYGHAIAADTGGAIKGNRIDLCMEKRREAINFGRRPVKVYVLE